MSFGGETIANALLPALLSGEDITLPVLDLEDALYTIPGGTDSAMYQPVVKITNDELTQQRIDGDGTFDKIMGGFRAQLVEEFKQGRISGGEYTKAFTALAESAMSNAVQFLIARDQSFWQAATAQAQAVTARVNLVTAKIQYAAIRMEAMNNRAQYGLTKLKLASEDAQYGSIKYNVNNILPLQKDQLDLQNDISTFQRDSMLPAQEAGQVKQNAILDYQLATQLPAQTNLLNEQKEAARAQTLDTRSDGVTTIVGVLGKQKDLYTQQKSSYQRDAELKVAKAFTDIWTVNKTVDEGAVVPKQVQVHDGTGGTTAGEGPLYVILNTLKANVGL